MLMARQLVNWREVWRAYRAGIPIPALRFRNGATLRHGPRDAAVFLFFEVFANGCYRKALPATLDGVIVDVGANIGAFVLDAAIRYPTARIHAYEPDPETCRMLRQNVTANGLDGVVTVWNEAVAAAAGRLTLWRGDASVVSSAYLSASHRGQPCVVDTVAMRTVIERAGGRVSLLKIDAEGAEADILEAAGSDLDRVDRMVGEFHESLVPGVRRRLEVALAGSFETTFSDSGRCTSMWRARRATTSRPAA